MSSEDKAWLISVLNTHAEIHDFKNVIAYLLGWCHQNSVGFAKDYEEAVRLYTLSSQQGHSDAQCNLGVCYQNGFGVVQDYKEAVRLFTLSSQQGHSGAHYKLGVCYQNGFGVVKDHEEAVRLFTLAVILMHSAIWDGVIIMVWSCER